MQRRGSHGTPRYALVFDCDVFADVTDTFRLQMTQNQRALVPTLRMSTALWGDLTYTGVYDKIGDLYECVC
jgi:hypothetical protein